MAGLNCERLDEALERVVEAIDGPGRGGERLRSALRGFALEVASHVLWELRSVAAENGGRLPPEALQERAVGHSLLAVGHPTVSG